MSAGKAAVLHEAALPLPSTGMLVDAKWQFGVTVSTNDVARAGATYVDMKFVTDEGGKLVTHSVELSLTQFYCILGQLESAKSYVDLMSPDTASAAK
ncbi:hypothetical protein EON66_04925 [archaeon]|nr:MAG: hypothetical protein EON66_04925 [archaeon]